LLGRRVKIRGKRDGEVNWTKKRGRIETREDKVERVRTDGRIER
jgi:hypothetical protein